MAERVRAAYIPSLAAEINCTDQPVQGGARSEAVVTTDSLGPRTPEQACSTFSDSLLPGTYQSYHPSGRSDGIYKIHTVGGWEQARARGLGRAYAVAPGRWLEGAAAAITSDFPRAQGAEREVSAPRVRMRCYAKMGNSACECQTTMKDARDDTRKYLSGAREGRTAISRVSRSKRYIVICSAKHFPIFKKSRIKAKSAAYG
eukprot:4027219-Pleurochrysis_carterae.AAC.5